MDKKQDNNDVIEKILSGARWAAAFRLIAQGISWIITLVVVRFISPSDYGLNAMLEAPLQLLMLFCTLGMDSALVRSKSISDNELRNVFGFLLITDGVLFLCYFFGAALIAVYFKEPRLEQLAKVLAFAFLLVPFRIVPNALLARDLKFKLKAFIELISGVVAAITTLVLAILGFGVWALVIGTLVNRLLSSIILMVLHPWFVVPSFNLTIVRDLMAFGRIMVLGNTVTRISEMLITVIAGPILGAHLLGIFSVAFQFALLPLSKVMPIINSIIFPAFSKFQGMRKEATYYLIRSLGVISLGLFPVMVGTACIAHELTLNVFGLKWQDAAFPLSLLSLAMLFRVTTNILRPVMSSLGDPRLSLKSSLLTLFILFPLVLIGVNYGVMGLVFAVLITESTVMFSTIGISKSILNTSFRDSIKCLQPALMSSAIMAVFVLGLKAFINGRYGIWGLLIEIGTGAITYYLSLLIFYRKSLKGAFAVLVGGR